MSNQLLLWIGFNLFIIVLLSLDLGLFNRKAHKISTKEALTWSFVWIGFALLFNLLIYYFFGEQKAVEFLTAYLVEKSLSIDNIFVFILIFSSFKTPEKYRHKILFWGVVGALILRGVMIFSGISLLNHFHSISYIFGMILIIAGLRMLFQKKESVETQPLFKWVLKRFPVARGPESGDFFSKIRGKRVLTNLGVTLILIEISDLVFALDSIPAVLGITSDLFIVYTSNVFAIMGLRSLFFVLGRVIELFHYLPYGLALILIFIGVRMFLPENLQFSTQMELLTICTILTLSILTSVIFKKSKS
jgi:tellurite resistance protein TerC